MDITENKVCCESCWSAVDSANFGLCVSCKAPFHAECRRSEPRCPTFGCGGITMMTSQDYIAGAGRDLPEDTEARVKVLLARRTSLLEDYRRASLGSGVMGAAFFLIATVFATIISVTNIGPTGFFAAVVIATFSISCVIYYLHYDTKHLLSRIALIDVELNAIGRHWDGSAMPPAPAPKAA